MKMYKQLCYFLLTIIIILILINNFKNVYITSYAISFRNNVDISVLLEPIKTMTILKTTIYKFVPFHTNHFSHWSILATTTNGNNYIISTTRINSLEVYNVNKVYIKYDQNDVKNNTNRNELKLNNLTINYPDNFDISKIDKDYKVIDFINKYDRDELRLESITDTYNVLHEIGTDYNMLCKNTLGIDVVDFVYKLVRYTHYSSFNHNCHEYVYRMLYAFTNCKQYDNVKFKELCKQIIQEL